MSGFGGFDIGSFAFRPPEAVPNWYEFKLHHHKDMNEHQRRAHIYSMQGSQGREHGQRLRLVLTKEDCYVEGRDPWQAESYPVPGHLECARICEEVVIRRPDLEPGREFVVKCKNGHPGLFRPISSPAVVSALAMSSGRPVLDL